jgi:two-component system response regulator YesN
LFKQATGKNFVEWLSEYRIKKAMYFLDQPGAVIKEVCFKVGYNDPNYFSRIFKKISGMTPKEYMNRSDD